MRNALVPVIGHRCAFEDGCEKTSDEVASDDAFGKEEENAEPANYAEQTVIQENKGGLERNGGAEVEGLYS